MWYGKGPGVDRCGDVFKPRQSRRHLAARRRAGRGRRRPHLQRPPPLPHQSEFAFVDAMMPVLVPAGVQEILDYGLYGWAHVALHRHSGSAIKAIAGHGRIDRRRSTARSTARSSSLPDDFAHAAGRPATSAGATSRWSKKRGCTSSSCRAALAFPRANKHRPRSCWRQRRRGSASSPPARAYLDVLPGARGPRHRREGRAISASGVYKVGMHLAARAATASALRRRPRDIIVVEEKRPLIEIQMQEHMLYGRRQRAAA